MTDEIKKKRTDNEGVTAASQPVSQPVFKPLGIAEGETLEMYTEQAFVSIAPVGEGELLFETFSDTIDIDLGEKGVDFIANLAGGRITKFLPMDDSTISLDIYPIQAATVTWPSAGSTKTATGVFDLFQSEDTGQPTSLFITSRLRQKVRLTLMLTDAASLASGAALTALTTSQTGLRMSFAGGYITKIHPTFTPSDGLKFTVTLKFPAMNLTGKKAMCYVQSTTTTAGLAALANYTTNTMFVNTTN